MRNFLRPASVYHGKQLPNPTLHHERFMEMVHTGRSATLEMEPPYRIKYTGEVNGNPPPLGSIHVIKGIDGVYYAVDMRAHQKWARDNLNTIISYKVQGIL